VLHGTDQVDAVAADHEGEYFLEELERELLEDRSGLG
jgi:hypothetical protein